MASKKCFKHSCELEVKYICKCSDFEISSCDIHFGRHLKLTDRIHRFESILSQPDEEINESVEKEIIKKEKLKKKVLVSTEKDKYKNDLKRRKGELNKVELNNCSKKEIKKFRNSVIEQDLRYPKPKTIKEDSSDYSMINETKLSKAKHKALDKEINNKIKKKTLLDYQLPIDVSKKWATKQNKSPLKSVNLQDLNDKISMLWSQAIDPETEQDFRRVCSFFNNHKSISDPALKQAYKDYVNAYHKATSIYHFEYIHERTQLHICDTESEKVYIKVLNIPKPLSKDTCITQLPNGELFCYGSDPPSGIAIIIDRNYNIRKLPNGPYILDSSVIYFNKNIYCFGGYDGWNYLALSSRFDLDKSQWFTLTEMPEVDLDCHSVIFNEKILICGKWNRHLLVYSVDVDSFSQVPYLLTMNTGKVLINTDRLYLIEFDNFFIYESEIGDEYAWKQIGNSKLDYFYFQQYWIYNKGGIYILGNGHRRYWKFDLNKKTLKKLE